MKTWTAKVFETSRLKRKIYARGGRQMSRANPQQQGTAFESLLYELIQRIFTKDLRYTLLQHNLQPPGIQFGKDIQTRWRDQEGRESFWHFECKSHKKGVLNLKEVADKIVDIRRSAHPIHVWCLTLAHIEPGTPVDEHIASWNKDFSIPFRLTILSPQRHFIKKLFALYPDLYSQLYGTKSPPALDAKGRKERITEFKLFLTRETDQGRNKTAFSAEYRVLQPIQRVLHYERDNESPTVFRESFKPLGVDFGPVPPATNRRSGAVFVPPPWKRCFAQLAEGRRSRDILWAVSRASTGKTTFGLWLGYSWSLRRPDWAVFCLDAKQVPDPEKDVRAVSEDLARVGERQLFLILDNLHIWHQHARVILSELPPPNQSRKYVFLSRPQTEVEEILESQKKKYRGRIIEAGWGGQAYVRGVVRSYFRHVIKTKISTTRLERLVSQIFREFKDDLISTYYALEELRQKPRTLHAQVDSVLAADGSWREVRAKVLEVGSAPSEKLTALLAVAALSRFELSTKQRFLVEQLTIDEGALNSLVDQTLLSRHHFAEGDKAAGTSYLTYPHETAARVVLKACERYWDEVPRDARQKLGNSPGWPNKVLIEYSRYTDLDLESLIHRGYLSELPEVIGDCTEYIRDRYPLEIARLVELLAIRAGACRRRAGPGDLIMANTCLDEATRLLGDHYSLRRVTRGRLLYDRGMVWYYQNHPEAVQCFEEGINADRNAGRTIGALINEAQKWVVVARLTPLTYEQVDVRNIETTNVDKWIDARNNLRRTLVKFQREAGVPGQSKKPTADGLKRLALQWIANCQMHIAELSVDLEDDGEVPQLLRVAREIYESLGYIRTRRPVFEFIWGKYFLRRRDGKRARMHLKEAVSLFESGVRELERVTEVWVALGDAHWMLGQKKRAWDWYQRAATHSGEVANAFGKMLGEKRLNSLTV